MKLYKAKMQQYAPGADPNGRSSPTAGRWPTLRQDDVGREVPDAARDCATRCAA